MNQQNQNQNQNQNVLPRETKPTASQNGQTHQDLVAVDNEDSVFSQGDPPSGVKKQVPPVTATAIQADQPQRLSRTDDPQQAKDRSRKDHLRAPEEAPDAQQSTA